MTPKEKAKGLIDKFKQYTFAGEDVSATQVAITCASIAVDEILKITPATVHFFKKETDLGYTEYWQQVKEEIKKL